MGKRSREKRERRVLEKKYFYQSSLEKICLRIIKRGTYLILFTPLILSSRFFFPFVGPKSLFFMALCQIIFFSWLILIFIEKKYRPKFNFLFLALIIYLFVFILSSIFGVNPSYSFWSKYERMTGILMQFHLFFFFLVLSSVFREEDFKKIFGFSVFVAILASLYALANLKNPTMRGGGTIGNESFLGTYLIFNIFFSLYLVFKTRGLSRKLSLISFSILILSILLIGLNLKDLSFSQKISAILFKAGARAAKLSVFGGLILFFFFWLISSQKKSLKIVGTLLLVFSLILISYFTFLFFQPESFVKKFVEREIGTFGGRLIVWQGAWKAFKERPWLGWGPENFEFSFTKYFNPCMFTPECGGEIWYDRAHNIFFDTAVQTGIFGLISYSLIFLASFYILWKNFISKKTDFWPAGIFTSLLISYFVQNLTVFDMVSSYSMLFLVLGFIGSIATPREAHPLQKTVSPKFVGPSFLILIFIFSFFYFIIQPLRTDYYVISALRFPPASKERLNFYKKTLEASPLGKYQIRDFFGQTTLDFAQSEKVKEVLAENLKKEIDFVIEELEKSIKESPLDFRSHLKLGQLYNAYAVLIDQKKIFEAERILIQAIEISPTNQQGYWSLAQTRIYQRRFNDALSLAEKALSLEPRLFQSHRIVIQIAKIMGNDQLAEKKIKQAIEINPQWEKNLKNF